MKTKMIELTEKEVDNLGLAVDAAVRQYDYLVKQNQCVDKEKVIDAIRDLGSIQKKLKG